MLTPVISIVGAVVITGNWPGIAQKFQLVSLIDEFLLMHFSKGFPNFSGMCTSK